jgi:hypothetical protein
MPFEGFYTRFEEKRYPGCQAVQQRDQNQFAIADAGFLIGYSAALSENLGFRPKKV